MCVVRWVCWRVFVGGGVGIVLVVVGLVVVAEIVE